jgi:hypothetical protein
MPYFQPSLRTGTPRVFDMLLLCLDEPGPTVPANTVTAFLDEYFSLCEKDFDISVDTDFRALRQRAAGLNADGRVPLWPLDRLSDVPRFHRVTS